MLICCFIVAPLLRALLRHDDLLLDLAFLSGGHSGSPFVLSSLKFVKEPQFHLRMGRGERMYNLVFLSMAYTAPSNAQRMPDLPLNTAGGHSLTLSFTLRRASFPNSSNSNSISYYIKCGLRNAEYAQRHLSRIRSAVNRHRFHWDPRCQHLISSAERREVGYGLTGFCTTLCYK